ncbi:hypothetical protein HHK36_018622 [Tetracentron sinense]|uniref:F-box domain-containing protein n=1 Tax=Tetracentron sinense TaxID=13715 RepID=A0A834YW98_TETSI|nr:hypothetical protein HHK36_018622 [Tetracentron sinense]
MDEGEKCGLVLEKNKIDMAKWLDLPKELLELILGRLFFIDHMCFRAVCRIWRSINHVQPMKQLPWLMVYFNPRENVLVPPQENDLVPPPEYEGVLSSWKLFDPSSRKTYTIKIKDHMDFSTTEVCASKHGWLLLSQNCINGEAKPPYSLLFLYNPFTKERINLPNLDVRSCFSTTTFSSLPTSPDCVFFSIDYDYHKGMVCISTCHCGDKTWTTHIYDTFGWPQRFSVMNYRNIVFYKGMFYFLNCYGTLVIFDVAKGRLISDIDKPVGTSKLYTGPPHFPVFETYLVESDGELFVILICNMSSWVRVWRLDHSQMAWVSVESLGNRTIFLGCTPLSADALLRVKQFKEWPTLAKMSQDVKEDEGDVHDNIEYDYIGKGNPRDQTHPPVLKHLLLTLAGIDMIEMDDIGEREKYKTFEYGLLPISNLIFFDGTAIGPTSEATGQSQGADGVDESQPFNAPRGLCRLRVFVGTWNVAGRSPVGNLDDWFILKDANNIYALRYCSDILHLALSISVTASSCKLADQDSKREVDSHALSMAYGVGEEAVELFEEMVSKVQVMPDALTYNVLVNGFCQEGKVDQARKTMDFMRKNGCCPNIFNYSALMDRFCKEGRVEEAILMRKSGMKVDVVGYTTLINYLCRFLLRSKLAMYSFACRLIFASFIASD